MSIEKDLTRIADALEQIAKGDAAGQIATALEKLLAGAPVAAPAEEAPKDKPASTGSRRQAKNVEREDKPEPPAPEPEPEEQPAEDDMGLDDPEDEQPAEPEEPSFTEDEVRKALKNFRDINGSDAVMKVLKDHGASGMGSLKPEQYASVMKAVR